MKRLLTFLLAVMPLFAVSVASQTLQLWYNFVPGEDSTGGKYNPEERKLLYFIDPYDGVANFNAAVVGSPYADSCTFYSMPPAGMTIDYWLVSKTRDYVTYDMADARTSAGAKTHVQTYDGTGGNVYIGARFKYLSYGVSFAGNGNTGGGMSQLSGIVYTNSFALPANGFAKTGYSFAGWTDGVSRYFVDCQTVTGSSFGVLDDGTNVVLAAQWAPKTYTMSLDPNGGVYSGSTSPQLVPNALTYEATTCNMVGVPTRNGYTFAGWYDAATGGNAVWDANGQAVNGVYWSGSGAQAVYVHDGNLYAYARWTPKTYYLSYSLGGGTAGQYAPTSAQFGNGVWISNPMRTGYTFAGWRVEYHDTTTAMYFDDTGSHLMNTSPFTLAPLPTGGVNVANLMQTDGTVLLTALWTPNTYNISYSLGGGTAGESAPTSTQFGYGVVVSNPTRMGYAFAGWSVSGHDTSIAIYSLDGETFQLMDSRPYTLVNLPSWGGIIANLTSANGATVTLTALWAPNTHNLSYNLGGGTAGAYTPSTAAYDEWTVIPAPTLSGYSFAGWRVTGHNTVTAYWSVELGVFDRMSTDPFDIVPISDGYSATYNLTPANGATVTFTALWTPKTYTMSHDPNGGEYNGSTSPQVVPNALTYGATASSIVGIPTWAGFSFAGWYDAATGGNAVWDATGAAVNGVYWSGSGAQAVYIHDGDLRAYAHWTGAAYLVVLDKQGGTGGADSVQAVYGVAMPTIVPPTRDGYTFSGYFTASEGGGLQYYAADGTSARTWDMTAATTLYAKWTVNTYTVALDAQGGTGGTEAVQATFDAAMPAITLPVRTGYTFGGYFTETDGGGVQYYAADGTGMAAWSCPEDTVLYAVWTANAYTIALDNQGGTGGMDSVQAVYGAAMPAVTPPTRVGYTFGGYFTESGGVGVQYYAADGSSVRSWDREESLTLYAVWIANTYTVSFDPGIGSGEMADQAFVYDEAQAITNCTFAPPAPGAPFWALSGWTNLSDNAFYEPGATVSNLTTVAGGVVNLVAVWVDVRGNLSTAMHCDNLIWYNVGTDGSYWGVKTGSGVGYGSDSCVTNAESSVMLAANVAKSGTLSFWAKRVDAKSSVVGYCQYKAEGNWDPVSQGLFDITDEWRQFTINVVKPEVEDKWWVQIRVFDITPSDHDPDLPPPAPYVCIDQMTWTPDSSGDEPTAEDARDISGISYDGGVLTLSFTNADERFSYNLRGTNTLAAPLALWPILWTTNGTGTITITPPVMPLEPQFFYYLETTAK